MSAWPLVRATIFAVGAWCWAHYYMEAYSYRIDFERAYGHRAPRYRIFTGGAKTWEPS